MIGDFDRLSDEPFECMLIELDKETCVGCISIEKRKGNIDVILIPRSPST